MMDFGYFAPSYQNTRAYTHTQIQKPEPSTVAVGAAQPRGGPSAQPGGPSTTPAPHFKAGRPANGTPPAHRLPAARPTLPHRHYYPHPPYRAVTNTGRPPAARRQLPAKAPPRAQPAGAAAVRLTATTSSPREPAPACLGHPAHRGPAAPPPPARGGRCRRPPVRPAALPWQQRGPAPPPPPPAHTCSDGHRRRWPPRTKLLPASPAPSSLPSFVAMETGLRAPAGFAGLRAR